MKQPTTTGNLRKALPLHAIVFELILIYVYSIQVNCLSQSLLALLLLPRMIHTGKEYSTTPRLVVVSSEVHFLATLPQKIVESSNILETLGSKQCWTGSGGQYAITKRRYTAPRYSTFSDDNF
jgi:hypothetical protein